MFYCSFVKILPMLVFLTIIGPGIGQGYLKVKVKFEHTLKRPMKHCV